MCHKYVYTFNFDEMQVFIIEVLYFRGTLEKYSTTANS